jgi:hypothetical protein
MQYHILYFSLLTEKIVINMLRQEHIIFLIENLVWQLLGIQQEV